MARTKLGVDVIVHATENEEAITDSLVQKLCIDPKKIDRTRTPGHFGNPIVMLRAEMSGKDAKPVLATLRNELGWGDREQSAPEISRHVQDGALYIRLDKQELVGGRVVRSEIGTVRIRVSAPAYGGEKAADVYADLFAE